jgi:predicted  nucleic acid-binding Zn-ribbon protein
MNADLERVIALQRLDSAAHDAQRRLSAEPERENQIEAQLAAARERLAAARDRLAASQTERRALEKDVALHQGRLSKFREQAMAVKTNQEYHALQKEIEFAQTEVKVSEDKVLERMLEADELAAALKRAETDLGAEQKSAEAERKAIAVENAELHASLERIGAQRAELARTLDPRVLAIFELVANRRHGIAVAEARDGICTICHVRLRPQVFNTIRRNDEIIQCDSCQRILYFVPRPAAAEAGQNVSSPPQ